MTKRIHSVQTLGALALVFILQACGGANNGMTGAAGTTGSGATTGTAGTTGVAGTTGQGGDTGAASVRACVAQVSKSGVKLETCTTAGTYSEMSGCTFNPVNDYSCYKIPAAANTVCPAGLMPQGSMDCGTVPECTSCNSLQGAVGGQYLDSQGNPKVGWCVCQAPNGDGLRTWSCATDTAWPCPLGAGCS